jgi:signal transduction histidine kinase
MSFYSKFHSISWKFLALLIPAVTGAAAIALFIYAYTKQQSSEVSLLEKIDEIAQVHNLSVAYPLWTLDFDGLERSIQTIALHSEIECVEVLELNEARPFYWPEQCTRHADERIYRTDLAFEDHTIGQLNLYYTTGPFTEALKREILTGALFFFLLVSVAGIVAFAALQTIVGRPVQHLMSSIRKAEKEDSREPLSWSSQDELGSVITAYNNMLQQVDENTNELIAAREQAESAAYTKSRFLANMSHELRTPLNAVIGITEMLREEAEDENKDTEPFDRVARSGRHLLHLIDDILDFSKIEAGKIELAFEEVSLGDLLDEVVATTEPLAKKNGNRLILEYNHSPAQIFTDPLRLRQIVLNLLSNACKFTENGTVSLVVEADTGNGAEGVRFSIADTGIGISKAQSDNLFEDFSQADISTTRRYGGTGLGLAISQRLCKLLGGAIQLQSTVGKGSNFSFTLPVK